MKFKKPDLSAPETQRALMAAIDRFISGTEIVTKALRSTKDM